MDSYIVRIYRRSGEDPESMAGLVEDVGKNEERPFTNAHELMDILNPTERRSEKCAPGVSRGRRKRMALQVIGS